MGTLAFDDFCFGNIGIPGDIGTIGKVRRKFVGAAFLFPPTRPRNRGKGKGKVCRSPARVDTGTLHRRVYLRHLSDKMT